MAMYCKHVNDDIKDHNFICNRRGIFTIVL